MATPPTLVSHRLILRAVARADIAARLVRGGGCRQSATYWVIEAEGELAGVAFLHSLSDADRRARFVIGMFAQSSSAVA